MKNVHFNNIVFTISIIVMFISVGIQPAFAEISIQSYNSAVNPAPISKEIYENSNCFVIGRTTHTQRGRNNDFGFTRFIGFGLALDNYDIFKPSEGWIYTKGAEGEWYYKGEIWGRLGRRLGIPAEIETYMGIEIFNGVCLVGITALSPFPTHFIGWADMVKISNTKPWP